MPQENALYWYKKKKKKKKKKKMVVETGPKHSRKAWSLS